MTAQPALRHRARVRSSYLQSNAPVPICSRRVNDSRRSAKCGYDSTPTHSVLWRVRAALSRAGLRLVVLAAFALDSTEGVCPPNFVRLDFEMAEMACSSAAVVANKTYGGSLSLKGYPAGCYWHTVNGSVYFFIKDATDAVAKVNSFVRQMCAGKADSRTAVCDTCERAR